MDVTSYLLGKNAGGGSQPVLQSKEIEITENGTTNVVADSGYDGLSKVEVTTNVSGGGIDEYLENTLSGNTSNQNTIAKYIVKKIPQFIVASNVTSLVNCYYNYADLEEVPLIDTSNITDVSGMHYGCSQLKTLPAYNTSNVTNFNNFAHSCTSLENVPIYNLSSVTGMTSTFRYCPNLTDTSLDNILQSLLTATSYAGTKTLKYVLGDDYKYSSYPASRIKALPHYQDFLDAGWTIGWN